ncbi:MAG: hypothetical protein IJS50_01595 [Desulfovibrio sp.]|nr:hypothetical protein [Desulfovibrio sp.]
MVNEHLPEVKDRLAAVQLQAHLFQKGYCVSLSLTNRLAQAGYIKTISAAMNRINRFLKKGYSANKAIEKILAMDLD